MIGSEPIRSVYELRVRGDVCVLGRRTWLMGVVNVTPDSFWEGSRRGVDAAVVRGLELFEQGADIVDVGGESTRPQGARTAHLRRLPYDPACQISKLLSVVMSARSSG